MRKINTNQATHINLSLAVSSAPVLCKNILARLHLLIHVLQVLQLLIESLDVLLEIAPEAKECESRYSRVKGKVGERRLIVRERHAASAARGLVDRNTLSPENMPGARTETVRAVERCVASSEHVLSLPNRPQIRREHERQPLRSVCTSASASGPQRLQIKSMPFSFAVSEACNSAHSKLGLQLQ